MFLDVNNHHYVGCRCCLHNSITYASEQSNSNDSLSDRLIPLPSHVESNKGTLQVSSRSNILGEESADKDALRVLKEFLKENDIAVNKLFNKSSATIALGENNHLSPRVGKLQKLLELPELSSLKSEGYMLAIRSETNDISHGGIIFIEGKDKDGTFYAVKTLVQLAKKDNGSLVFKNSLITDEPSMSVRGIIEGFYGDPWSHHDRLDQIHFYGDYKMNTYIYAPKDDPYHREKWREPYPENEMERMKELIYTAKKNKVDFTFAISPGIDIRFNGQGGEDDF